MATLEIFTSDGDRLVSEAASVDVPLNVTLGINATCFLDAFLGVHRETDGCGVLSIAADWLTRPLLVQWWPFQISYPWDSSPPSPPSPPLLLTPTSASTAYTFSPPPASPSASTTTTTLDAWVVVGMVAPVLLAALCVGACLGSRMQRLT